MRIETVTFHGLDGSPMLQWRDVHAGLNAIYGPPQSAQATVAGFLAHVLYGQPHAGWSPIAEHALPDGEVVIRRGNHRYRLRRYSEGVSAPRLTVAGLDGSPADHSTIHALVGRLSPAVLGPLCAVSFRDSPSVARLLNADFAREFDAFFGTRPNYGSRRTAELTARRDLLAHELETRIASERQISKDLDGRWRELERLVQEVQHQAGVYEQRVRAAEAALAETDSRLRYRRLELNVQLRWHAEEPVDCGPQLAALDDQIERLRATFAELGQQEANVRSHLAELQTSRGAAAAALVDQRAWLAVARQLAADLAGEVARLARASASQQCVCLDAHPRLRPIAETAERQLDVLQKLLEQQHGALASTDLQHELNALVRTQNELRSYLENLLERRQVVARGIRPSRLQPENGLVDEKSHYQGREGEGATWFSAADAEQLEERRMELEQERFALAEELTSLNRRLRDLRAQRDTVERQRAALLSARSIDHIQRELDDVQRKLAIVADHNCGDRDDAEKFALPNECVSRASDFLAQLTDGGLVQLTLVDHGRRAHVATREGDMLAVESLPASQRNLVYLSLSLALLSTLAQRGVWLPLVLEEPFAFLDGHRTPALAVVLHDFCRRGHQVLVLTNEPTAVDRLTSLGAAVRDIASLRALSSAIQDSAGQERTTAKPRQQPRVATRTRRKKPASRKPLNGKASAADHSDAA